MDIRYRPATADGVVFVAEHAKAEDRQEVMAAWGRDVKTDLLQAFQHSDFCSCALIGGVPVAVFGTIPDSAFGDRATVWLIFTEEVEKFRVVTAKECRRVLKDVLQVHSPVYNFVNVENKRIIRWLKWLGAEFVGPVRHGIWGKEHLYFQFRKEMV